MIAEPQGPSVYSHPFEDPRAISLGTDDYPVHRDGTTDDTDNLQRAINGASGPRGGIVFVPEGVYRLTGTLLVWGGVRLIGWGAARPELLLKADTAGFQSKEHPAYLIHCRDGAYDPSRTDSPPPDGANTTFYTGLCNINLRMEHGNPGAIGIRFRVAQLSYLEHVDIHAGREMTAVEQVGNRIERCRFYGGSWGIRTERTAAGWQTLIMDCLFEGQTEGAIQTKEAGLTLIRVGFHRCTRGIVIPPGQYEQLYMKDCELQELTGPAVTASRRIRPTLSDNGLHGPVDPRWHQSANQINLRQVQVDRTRILLDWHEDNEEAANMEAILSPASCSLIDRMSIGTQHSVGVDGREQTSSVPLLAYTVLPSGFGTSLLMVRDIPEAPAQSTWGNLATVAREWAAQHGTLPEEIRYYDEILAQAMESYETVYLPMGDYVVQDTVRLLPGTKLIGLHPALTRLRIDKRNPRFSDAAFPRPILHAPPQGTNQVSGIGLDPQVDAEPCGNEGCIPVLWQAGERSFLGDVYFEWGGPPGPKTEKLQETLLISEGGGGTFKDVWSFHVYAKAGIRIADTSAKGRMYLVSLEHRRSVELKLEQVENWEFYALQTEEERGGQEAKAMIIDNCRGLYFASLFLYRVGSLRGWNGEIPRHRINPTAVIIQHSEDIVFDGIHSFSWVLPHLMQDNAFEETIRVRDSGYVLKEREAGHVHLRPGKGTI